MKIQDNQVVIEEMTNAYILLLVRLVKKRNKLREAYVGEGVVLK
jgi:hypothetical protein